MKTAPVTRLRYTMLALVFLNVVINYLDRANLSVAAPELKKAIDLSPVEMGYIFSAFGWTYAALQIPGGFLADRIAPRILYAVCLITWSFATMAQGLATSFVKLFGLRLATGAFESPSYPINNRIVTSWFPDNERASATALYVSGQFIGLAFLTPLLGELVVRVGWQGIFFITGVIGVLWGIVWYVGYRDPLDSKRVSAAELEYIEEGGAVLRRKGIDGEQRKSGWTSADWKLISGSRTLWGVFIGQFCVNGTLYFFLTWFPTYLVQYRGFTYIKTGYLASIPFLAACAGLLLSGFLSDALVKKGTSINVARKAPIITGLILSMSIIGANYVDDTFYVIFFMSLAFFGSGMALISWVFVSLLSPKHMIGLTGGIFNFCGNLASIVVPIAIGHIVTDQHFEPALLLVGSLGLAGACSYIFLVGKIVRIGGN